MTPEWSAEERRLAEEPLDAADEALLEQVRTLYRDADPVPGDLATEIKFRLTVQALHAEVAELQRADALEHDGALTRSDGYAQTETMTFACDQLTAMITVTAVDEGTVRVDGWVTTAGCAIELRVRPIEGGTASVRSWTTTADEDGRFTFAVVAKGMAQLVLRSDDEESSTARPPVITPHVEI